MIAKGFFDYRGNWIEFPEDLRERVANLIGENAQHCDGFLETSAAALKRDANHWLLPAPFVDGLDLQGWLLLPESGEQRESGADLLFTETGDLILDDFPEGYHQLDLISGSGSRRLQVLAAPEKVYGANIPAEREKLLGIGCQLYSLRSGHNWGIGDFSDLSKLIEDCASVGLGFIALNPLHAPVFRGDSCTSPYYPSDRRYLNPLYLNPQAVRRSLQLPAGILQDFMERNAGEIEKLREADRVDYPRVFELKVHALLCVFSHWWRDDEALLSHDKSGFQDFLNSSGPALREFARHQWETCNQELGIRSGEPFFEFLQWQCEICVARCQAQAKEQGMSIGLIGDLAVGSAREGNEMASTGDAFIDGATIGSPPDEFAPGGQDWGLPPPNPKAVYSGDSSYFAQLIQANMHLYGALRIDHVMALYRLWWRLPEGGGVYVHYPVDVLMAIVRLESHRNQCRVVGEDMGMVPDKIREMMSRSGMLGNRLFYFYTNPDGFFNWPSDHESELLFQISNHDVPTLAGWWSETDLNLCAALGMEVTDSQREFRYQQKNWLLDWLRQCGEEVDYETLDTPMNRDLTGKIFRCCAFSQARLLMFQLEDLQLIEEPVNLPGTWKEYPNWQRKQHLSSQALFQDSWVQALIRETKSRRDRIAGKE